MADVLRLPRSEHHEVRLHISAWRPNDEARAAELSRCMARNLVALGTVHEHVGNPTYGSMLDAMREVYERGEWGAADITILANADIEFPRETIDLLRHVDLGNHAFALTRWNPEPDGTLKLQHPHPRGSQDCWIFQGPPKDVRADFTMGRPGCDNRFAKELDLAGYDVRNPSLTLKTIHRHTSEVRNYTRADVVERPYLLVEPCELEVM